MQKKLGLKQILIIAAVPLVIIATILLLRGFNKSEADISGAQSGEESLLLTEVPNVKWKSASIAQKALEELGFSVTLEYLHSTGVSKNYIIEQSSPRGSKLEPGSEIVLTVSLGPVMVTVPELVGLPVAEAINLLREAGLEYTVENSYDNSVEAGLVVSQSIASGNSVEIGSVVALQVNANTITAERIYLHAGLYSGSGRVFVVPIGESIEINYTIYPYEAYYTQIEWDLDNTSIATVSNGTVTGLSDGKVTLTATLENDRNVSAVCTIYVIKDKAVHIKDRSIKRFVREITGNFDGEIMLSDTMRMEDFGDYLNPLTPGSLDDLIYFPNIEYMFIDLKKVDDLSPLAYCNKLNYLVITKCSATDISVFGQLTDIKSLMIYNMTIIDSSPLKNLNKINRLRIRGCEITDYSFLSSLNNLNELYIIESGIRNIEPLAGLNNLKTLLLMDNKIVDINPLKTLASLEILYLDDNRIKDISPLEYCESLVVLSVNNNRISDLSAVSGLSKLRQLHAAGNRISDLSPLSYITPNTLELSYNNITDLRALESNKKLYTLILEGNPISSTESLVKLKSLYDLYIWNTGLSEEDIAFIESALPNCRVYNVEYTDDY